MNQAQGVDPLRAEEMMYRRVPVVWKDLRLDAFLPHKTEDIDGLSLSREKVGPEGAAATGLSGKLYYTVDAAISEVERIERLTVFADSDTHALIPEMNSALRQSTDPEVKKRRNEYARALQLLFRQRPILGPYIGTS
jgi:hypothetical protein